MFTNVGFSHVPTRDQEFDVRGRRVELDAIFVEDNLIVVVEETLHSSAHVSDHLRKKAELFEWLADTDAVATALAQQFPPLRAYMARHPEIHEREYLVKFAYCSRYDIDEAYKARYREHCTVLEFGAIQYFLRLSRTIKRSARFELYKALGIELGDLAGPSRSVVHRYKALLLPEIQSGFPAGHQVVSFLIDPKTLIEQAYVLRADSWRDHDALYQRLLVKGKIASMREYLTGEHRVFVNNIIVTLPPTTEFRTTQGRSGGREGIAVGDLAIPRSFNTVGIVDGQHRVYAYHEGDDKHERRIAPLRDRQHLLVTGIIYPESVSESKARVFEAKLFLEINDKQKRVRGELKQAIERIVNPYSSIAISKAVVERLAKAGPLQGLVEVHFFDAGKIKTASIVSYGLRHIVDVNGATSLFSVWPGPAKLQVQRKLNRAALAEYIAFVSRELSMFISGFKENVDKSLWVTDRKVSRALSATTINGLVFCMRRLIEHKQVAGDFATYRNAFAKMRLDFRPGKFQFKSSHWRELGDTLYSQCFATGAGRDELAERRT